MPLDPSFVPALEEELWAAERVKPGGQQPDPGRIAAIEAEIKKHKAAAERVEEAGDKSNESTDYESHDADADKVKAARDKAAKRAEKAVDKRDGENTAA